MQTLEAQAALWQLAHRSGGTALRRRRKLWKRACAIPLSLFLHLYCSQFDCTTLLGRRQHGSALAVVWPGFQASRHDGGSAGMACMMLMLLLACLAACATRLCDPRRRRRRCRRRPAEASVGSVPQRPAGVTGQAAAARRRDHRESRSAGTREARCSFRCTLPPPPAQLLSHVGPT